MSLEMRRIKDLIVLDDLLPWFLLLCMECSYYNGFILWPWPSSYYWWFIDIKPANVESMCYRCTVLRTAMIHRFLYCFKSTSKNKMRSVIQLAMYEVGLPRDHVNAHRDIRARNPIYIQVCRE